jgi:hypothetical protein
MNPALNLALSTESNIRRYPLFISLEIAVALKKSDTLFQC